MIRAGKLNQRITFQRSTRVVEDETWGPRTEWQDFASCWAEVTPAQAPEAVKDGAVQSATGFTIRTRYMASITPAHRIQYRGRTLDIVSLIDVDNRRRELEIVAKEHPEAEAEAEANG
ncbi:MAG TPA: phage head closure protein [Tepidisphaeraceae bacterium]|nr:phage head closure protein [Tepidisphaeraceae bacterium]